MAEYIKRLDAVRVLEEMEDMEGGFAAMYEIPSADVAPVVHGHYVINDDGDASCSVCQEPYLSITQDYCPNCGAKMDLED